MKRINEPIRKITIEFNEDDLEILLAIAKTNIGIPNAVHNNEAIDRCRVYDFLAELKETIQ